MSTTKRKAWLARTGVLIGNVIVKFVAPVTILALIFTESFKALTACSLILIASRLTFLIKDIQGYFSHRKTPCVVMCMCGCDQPQAVIDSQNGMILCHSCCDCGCKRPCSRHREHFGRCVS